MNTRRFAVLVAALALAAIAFLTFPTPEPACAHSSCFVGSTTYAPVYHPCSAATGTCPASFPLRYNEDWCFRLDPIGNQ